MRTSPFVVFAAALGVCSVARAQDLFIENARIVDPVAEQVRVGTLLVLDGVIAGSPARAPSAFRGETLDASGNWLIPGLVDLHTHSYGNMAPGNVFDGPGTAVVMKRILCAGVTAFLDLFGQEDAMFALRAQQRAGEAGGADLFAAGPCLTATKGHCTEYGVPTRVMDTPADARRVVEQLAVKRPDVVKIVYSPRGRMPSIDEATLGEAVGTATANGIKTVVHINTWDDVREAVLAGATAVTHIPANQPVPQDLPRLMAERGVAIIPTLAVETDMGDFIRDASVLASPLAATVTTNAVIGAYRTDSIRHHAEEWAERAARQKATIFRSLRALADAGVVVLTGTDAGNYGTIQGFSVHRELEKLVQAGFTPWEALRAATTDAGAFLDRSFGVREGDEANLVLLEASPIESIRHTQRISAVVHHGRVIDRERLLEEAGPGR